MNYEIVFRQHKLIFYEYINLLYYNDCIRDYVEIFTDSYYYYDDYDLIVECEETYIHNNIIKTYIRSVKNCIEYYNDDILDEYFSINHDGKLILSNKPKYNKKLSYKIIYYKLKEYKDKNNMFFHIFLILNKDYNVIKFIKYNYNYNSYQINFEDKCLFIIGGNYSVEIPNIFLNTYTHFNKDVTFTYNFDINNINVKLHLSITFDEIPTCEDIAKYSKLNILYTIELMCLRMTENYALYGCNSNDNPYDLYKDCRKHKYDKINKQIIPQFIEKIDIINNTYNINLLEVIKSKRRHSRLIDKYSSPQLPIINITKLNYENNIVEIDYIPRSI